MDPIDVKISEAIMNMQENSIQVSQKVRIILKTEADVSFCSTNFTILAGFPWMWATQTKHDLPSHTFPQRHKFYGPISPLQPRRQAHHCCWNKFRSTGKKSQRQNRRRFLSFKPTCLSFFFSWFHFCRRTTWRKSWNTPKSFGPPYQRRCVQVRGSHQGTSAGTEQQRAGTPHEKHLDTVFLLPSR